MYIHNILHNVIYIFGSGTTATVLREGGVIHFFLGGPRLMKTWCWSEAIWGSWFSLGRAMAVFRYSCFNKKDNYKKNKPYKYLFINITTCTYKYSDIW